MSTLSAQIFATDDIESETLFVPQWNVTVMVKSMTAKARSQMIANAVENGGQFNVQELLPDMVIMCTYDPTTGERVFFESDREALMAKSSAPIELIANTAMRLSGMVDNADGTSAVDEAGKDFSPTLTDDSSTN